MKYLHIAVFSSLILIICGGYICFSLIADSVNKHSAKTNSIHGSITTFSGYQKLPDVFSYSLSEVLITPPKILSEYEKDYQLNNDLAGHITIPNIIDLNIMQSIHDPNFYLTHTYDKSEKKYGAPYIDARCSIYPTSDNIIVYGHNMNNDMMFSSLMKYKEESFYKENPTITFNTIYEKSTYKICSVFIENIQDTSDTIDPYSFYNTINISSYVEHTSFTKNIGKNKLYETNYEPQFGDSFLTLVTCTNSTLNSDERFVIVAVKTD